MSKRLDAVLVNPGSRMQVYQVLGSELAAIEPPVWAGLMATYLRRHGRTVTIIDAEAEALAPDQVAERIKALNPVLAAVVVYGHQPSASTQNMTAAGAICAAIKQSSPEQPVFLVGGHVAALSERTLEEEDADFVCSGEGPITLLELVEALQSTSPDFSKVRGLLYRQDGRIERTSAAPLLKDLDGEMPGVAWDLLPMDKYRAHNWHSFQDLKRQPYAAIYTTLGCPYHCSFCLRAGTMITTVHGRNKKIEDIRVGDLVLAWDENAQRLSESTVVATGSRWVDRVLRIRMQTGETIEVTDEHPIYTPDGWVDAGKLQTGQQILVMEKSDKLAYLRTAHNPSKRPEVRAKIAQRRREHNPARLPEVRAKISATLKQQREALAARLKRLHAEGRIPYVPLSEARRREQSERMKRHNPMKNGVVARKVADTLKQRVASGQLIPYLKTLEGRRVIAEIARQRALTNNPMKDPAVAQAESLRQRRAKLMRAVWQDEAQADRLMASREGTYVTGARHWAWQGGISQDPYPPKFTAYLKRKIRRRDGYTCQHCGRQDALSVHHIDYDKANCDPCNLITLCVSCNSKANANRERWQAYYQDKMALIGNCPRFVAIESIEEVRGQFQVFNFQCSPHDNYFAERLLVHNCCIQAPFKSGEKELGLNQSTNSYRFWSVESVMAQLDTLVRTYGVRNVKIADEMFVLHPKHVLGICEAIIARGYDLNIWAYARVDTVREEMVDKLKAAGFHWLAFGIEAASERVRTDVQKGFGQDLIFRTIQRVHEAGINIIGNYIFGLPEDDLTTMQATLDMALELNCEFANLYSAMAYPGSALYQFAVQQGWPLPERWSGYSQHAVDTLPLPTKYLSGAEVLRFRDQAFQTYFTSPKYLEMVRRKFGEATVDHIRQMASHKLTRQSLAVAA